MKTKIALVIALFAVSIFCSCEKEVKISDLGEHGYVNNWILNNMKTYYLWNEEIPAVTNKTLPPSDYFKSLLHSDDRFSWIQDNYLELLNSLSGVSMEAGYDFNLVLMDDNHIVLGYITYIKPDSPADAQGLRRGDYFTGINGNSMNIDNYSEVIAGMSHNHNLHLCTLGEGNVIFDSITVPVTVVEYEENPVFLDSIYHVEEKKIGYLVYNAFYADNGDNSLSYEKQLNKVFGKFKAQGIDELIVDLRYNSGGLITSAIDLASMIVKDLNTSNVCIKTQYNSILTSALRNQYGTDYFNEYFRNKFERRSGDRVVETIPINNVGVQRVHFIVSNHTASASELVINSLIPFIDVILVGTTTTGKNVGSISIYEKDDPNNRWGMQPLVLKLANSVGFSDYGKGFQPNVRSYEYKDILIKPLGDLSETMLAAAIDNIFGRVRASSKSPAKDKLRIVGSSLNLNPARANMTYPAPDLKFSE